MRDFEDKYDFVAANGTPFRAVIDYRQPTKLTTGSVIGGGLTVTFYDRRYEFTPNGQHTGATYYLETLLEGYERLSESGLDLHTGVSDWTLDARSTRTLLNWIMEVDSAL